MSNKGFNSSALAYIRLIRDNLRDRYDNGYPILKEIIQNADDSGASELHFGVCPGFPEDEHPLAKAPAVFFLNNGNFTSSDERAIREFGFGYKATDKGSVGKFGLGLKSVFHWCEAFFYLYADPSRNDTCSCPKGDILNPWSDGNPDSSKHADWDTCYPSTLERLFSHVKPFANGSKFFCLWIPLRRAEDLCNVSPIVESYPSWTDGSAVSEASLWGNAENEIVALLPLLKCVRKIACWGVDGIENRLTPQYEVSLEDSSQQRFFPDLSEDGTAHPKVGYVRRRYFSGNEQEDHLLYAGLEVTSNVTTFSELKDSSFWPKDVGMNKETGKDEEVPEKAFPNASVTIMSQPLPGGESGSLHITWATFLPVGTEDSYPLPVPLKVRVALHGYFFLDAGRKHIEGQGEDAPKYFANEESVRKHWNASIRNNAVLPLLIPAFQHWIKQCGVSDETIEVVTRALQESEPVKSNLKAITRDLQWVYSTRPDGTGTWQSAPPEARILAIPFPPASESNRPFTVFPQLAALCDEQIVTFHGKPLITRSLPSGCSGEVLDRLLTDVSIREVFTKPAFAEYFTDLICSATSQEPDPTDNLRLLLKRVLASIPLKDLGKCRQHVMRLLGSLPDSWLVSISENVPLHQEMICYAASTEVYPVLVPASFLDNGRPTTNDDDALFQVMKTFARPPEELSDHPEYPESCHRFITSLLKGPAAQKALGRDAARGFRLFSARKMSENRNVLLTLKEIAVADDDGILFTKTQGDLTKQLQEALSGPELYTVDSETYRYATGKQESYPCNITNCIRYIDEIRPQLRAPERRKPLLAALLPALDDHSDSVVRRVCRYLLHANPVAYASDLDLVASDRGESNDVWARLYRMMLEFKNDHWCYVDSVLTDLLNPSHQTQLSLVHAARINTERLFVEYKTDLPRLDLNALTDRERDLILEEIRDPDLLKALPVHQTIDGDLTSVDATTFLQSDVPTCSYVRATTRIVAKHINPELARRQEEIIHVLSAAHVLQIALKSENPETHWTLIADTLSSAKVSEFSAAIDSLRRTKWIPTHTGGAAVSPTQVLWIPGLESDIDRLRFPVDLEYAKQNELVEELWRHKGMKQHMEKLLPSLDDRLEMLAEVLSEDPNFRLGVRIADTEQLESFVQVFQGKNVLPVANVIHRLREKASVQSSQILHRMLPHLATGPTAEQFVSVLDHLSRESESALGESKVKILGWHNRYLESVRESRCLFEVLPQIRLKNRSGRWRSATHLCLHALGIRREDILNEEQAALLGLEYWGQSHDQHDETIPDETASRGPSQLSLSDIEGEVTQSASRLRNYFNAWANRLPDELIGGFLCFLGDMPEILQAAEQYLGQRSIKKTREALEWPPMNRQGRGYDETLQESMSEQRFIVRVVPDGEIEVESIAGSRFMAQQSKDIDSIFVGDTFRVVWRDGLKYRVNLLDLRPLDAGTIDQDGKLGEVLRTSLEQLFARVYCRQVPNVDAFWEELGESEQLDVAIAQDMLLDSLFTIIRQMGVDKKHDDLRDILDEYDRVRKQIAESTVKEKSNRFRDLDAEAKYSVRYKLVALLEQDAEVQLAVLDALRAKIKDYQYKAASIPFELFQNADDAMVELMEMRSMSLETGAEGAFVIIVSENSIRAMHWGRPINKFREGEFDGRGRGFDNDLEKMLVLSYSDKGARQGGSKVTGKFGLGFKSVFLVTDQPRVKSARLGFEVVSGFWPKLLSPEEQQELHSRLQRFRPDDRNGTLIELPDVTTPPREVLSDFRRLSPVLVAFSRAIRSIRIEGFDDEGSQHVVWKPESLSGDDTLSVSRLNLVPGEAPCAVLKVNAVPGAFLFKLEPNGFVRMPGDIPTVWVTAPTSETSGLGFAINGPFPLDVGRAQLSLDESSYQSLAHEIGLALLAGMKTLYESADSEWGMLIEKLHLRPDLEPYAFWFSVWELLVEPFADKRTQSENNAFKLMREVLWGESSDNLRTFYQEKSVIPTGLWDACCALTRSAEINTVLTGVLERREVFLCASRWGSATDLLRPGSVISSSVYEVVQGLGIVKRGCAEVTLIDLLEIDTARGAVVTPDKASLYGELINRARLEQLEKDKPLARKERESLHELLSNYKFIAEDGSAQASKDLVTLADPEFAKEEDAKSDEQLRAAFAPDSRSLAPAYSGIAISFFRVCRKELHAPVVSLVDWALVSQDESRRNAVLRYLLEGELGQRLGRELREKKRGTWLEDFHDLEYYQGLEEFQKIELDGLLGVRPLYGPSPEPPIPDPGLPPLEPAEVLNAIYAWWLGAKESETKEYERKVYPTGAFEPPILEYEADQIEHRKAWYSLFVLGMTHTMGRTKAEQHRTFLDRCRQRGWMDVFAAKDIDAESWIDVLDDFIDSPLDSDEFSHWMKLFPNLYRVSKWLDDYVEAFLAVDQFESDFVLNDITLVRSSQRFQGGGIDAPRIDRALGIGACFVMREIVRGRIVSQPLAHRHCYVPSRRIRNFFSELGCNLDGQHGPQVSILIYEFIVRFLGHEKASFEDSFDLPFIRLLDSKGNQRDILGREIADESVGDSWAVSSDRHGDFVTLWDGRVIPREYMN